MKHAKVITGTYKIVVSRKKINKQKKKNQTNKVNDKQEDKYYV